MTMNLKSSRQSTRQPAFTLVELLVVIGIIAVLIGAVFVVSNSVFAGAKERGTKAMMLVVQEALDEFQRSAPLGKVPKYSTYFNNYPPDQLALFTGTGLVIPTSPPSGVPNVSPGGSYLSGDPDPGTFDGTISNQDIKAAVLAIRLFSPTASSILDRLDSRYFATDKLADSLTPPNATTEYLDRDKNGALAAGDRPLQVIVDDWGQPIEVFSLRFSNAERQDSSLSPAFDREKFATDAVSFNNGQPILMSYGADGPAQLSNAVIASEFSNKPEEATVWWDYLNDATPKVMDNKYNLDNVFANDAIKTRLMEAKP